MSSFRTFLLSASFLKYYLIFDTDWSKHLRAVGAFERVRDIWLRGNVRSTFPTSWDDVDRHKPSRPRDETYSKLSVEDKAQKDQYLAQILILIVEEYTQAAPIVVIEARRSNTHSPKISYSSSQRAVPCRTSLADWYVCHRRSVTHQQAMKRKNQTSRRTTALSIFSDTCPTPVTTHGPAVMKSTIGINPKRSMHHTFPDFVQYEPIVKAPKYTVAEALKARNMPEKKFLLPWSTLERDDEAREYLKGNKDLPLPPQTGCSDLVTHVSSTSHNIAISYA
jgi:hypothetical protein